MWIVDFGTDMPIEEAALYEAPFEYVQNHVRPQRGDSRTTITEWWLHERPRVEMRAALSKLERYIATPTITKHRLFVWVSRDILPDHQLIVFARDDDYFFGVLHSRIHEVWALQKGTQLREVESGFRYTPTSTFETFPLPVPTSDQQQTIAESAKRLNALREGWLNPSELSIGPSQLKKRTLTNLYNDSPTWLRHAHQRLDETVFVAYEWPPDLSDGEIISRLLALNLERDSAGQ